MRPTLLSGLPFSGYVIDIDKLFSFFICPPVFLFRSVTIHLVYEVPIQHRRVALEKEGKGSFFPLAAVQGLWGPMPHLFASLSGYCLASTVKITKRCDSTPNAGRVEGYR